MDACGTCIGGNSNLTAQTWYEDADNDTWGKSGVTKYCNNAGSGWVLRGGDLNDNCYNVANDAGQCIDSLINNFCNDVATTQEVKNNISSTIAIIKSENCGYKSMYEELTSPSSIGNNSSGSKVVLDFCVEAWATKPYTAAYNPITGKINFNGDAGTTSSGIIAEELFHAYQDNFYVGGIDTIGKNPITGMPSVGFANIEFEHKVFKDIAQGYASAYGSMNASSFKDDYNLWLKSITDNFTKYPSITPNTPEYDAFIAGYNQQLANWNSVSGNPYHSVINPNLNPNAMLHLLKKNLKNCTP